MITRGYLVGEILDSLASVSEQVKLRCQVNLLDLNQHLENFFRDYLNTCMSWSLVNANAERSNAPGIDLIDESEGLGIQVTSQADASKVNETLAKVVKHKINDRCPKIVVLVAGKKQGSYKLNTADASLLGFTEENIWDIRDLARFAMDLEIGALKTLFDQVKNELVRVKMDLEIPNENGEFQTGISAFVEAIPRPHPTEAKVFYDFCVNADPDLSISLGQMKQAFELLSKTLSRLPRLTREVFCFLVERRDDEEMRTHGYGHSPYYAFDLKRLTNICNVPDLKGELGLLDRHSLIRVTEHDEDSEGIQYVRIQSEIGEVPFFLMELVRFADEKGLSLKIPLVSLDFRAY